MIIDEETQKRWDMELYTTCSFCETQYTFSEFMKCKSPWIDKKKKQYGKMTLCKCGVDLFSDRWGIVSKIDNYYVMTIHLPICVAGVEMKDWFDYNFWYETKFWQKEKGKSRKFAGYEVRYHTREEAIEGHLFVVQNINKILEHPERYPQGIMGRMINEIGAADAQRKVLQSDLKDRLK